MIYSENHRRCPILTPYFMNYIDLLGFLDDQQTTYTLVWNDTTNIAGVIHKLSVHDPKTFFSLWKFSGRPSPIQEIEHHLFFVLWTCQVFGFSFTPDEKRFISEMIEEDKREQADMDQWA